MDPSPGLLVLTEPTDSLVTGTVYVTPSSGIPIHLRQKADGRVLIGERAQDEVAKDPTMAHAATAGPDPRILPLAPRCRHGPFHRGVAPDAPDGMPIVGPLPGLASVYVAAAHVGVTLAPVLGELVAQEIIENKTAGAGLEPFRPARFSEHRTDAYLSIEEAFQLPSEVFLG